MQTKTKQTNKGQIKETTNSWLNKCVHRGKWN